MQLTDVLMVTVNYHIRGLNKVTAIYGDSDMAHAMFNIARCHEVMTLDQAYAGDPFATCHSSTSSWRQRRLFTKVSEVTSWLVQATTAASLNIWGTD